MSEEKKAAAKVEPLRKTHPARNAASHPTANTTRFARNRCREVDLSRWLSGSYAIPVADDEAKADYEDEE